MYRLAISLVFFVVTGAQAWAQNNVDDTIAMLQSSCRIRMNPGKRTESSGSGTFVDFDRKKFAGLLEDDEVLVASAAHVAECLTVRGSIEVDTIRGQDDGQGRIKVSFGPTYKARIIEFGDTNAEGDVALLAVKVPKEAVTEGYVIIAQYSPGKPTFNEGEWLTLIGCARGELPQVKYGQPIQADPGSDEKSPALILNVGRIKGDSGGGAFDKEGRLVAVCSGSRDDGKTMIGPGLKNFVMPRLESDVRNHFGPTSYFVPTKQIDAMLEKALAAKKR
jgi:hypothetical protein